MQIPSATPPRPDMSEPFAPTTPQAQQGKRSVFRLSFIIMVLFLGMISMVGLQLNNYRVTLLAEREQKTSALVENVYTLILYYYMKVTKEGLPEPEAQQIALNAIRQLRHDNKEYFWIIDKDSRMIMHAARPELEGRVMKNMKDPAGNSLEPLYQEIMNIVTTKQAGFVNYLWSKPGEDPKKPYPKLSYVKSFEPWGWIISSGIYIDDVDRSFWNAVYVTMALSIAILIFIIALAFTASTSVKNR